MSRLELLPQVVRRKIFQYLLLSDRIRQPPNHLLAEHYDFQINLLRLNRAIHAEASAILYSENAFIKVGWMWEQGYKSMLNHELPFFKLAKGVGFNHHVADVKIKFDKLRRKHFGAAESQTCLILLHDIPKLTRLLRILDVANFMGFNFDIKLRQPRLAPSPPDLATQEKLLLPFEKVRGMAIVQEVSITGLVDVGLVQRVVQAMTQRVASLRGGSWEIYEIVLSIKRMGDLAFNLGNADMACAKYIDALNFDKMAIEQNRMMSVLHNEPRNHAIARLQYTIDVDMALLAISDITEKEEGKRHFQLIPTSTHHMEDAEKLNKEIKKEVVPVTVIARFFHILGVAELGLNHPIKAAKSFVKAYSMVKIPETKAGWVAANAWKILTATDRKAHLNALLATLPTAPLPVPDMQPYRTPEVASEHWVMRQLGFKGDIPYADKVTSAIEIHLTTKPHPNHQGLGPRTTRIGKVKPEVLAKCVQKYRKSMITPTPQGKLMCWVGLNADEIGEESILDDPAAANMVATMSQSMESLELFGSYLDGLIHQVEHQRL